MSTRGGWLVWAYAQAYVLALTCVYLSCYLRVTEAQSGETTSFNCNDIAVKNQTHHIKRLKIASLNAEWLFDGRDDPSYSPWHPGKTSCPGMKHCGTEEGAQEHITKVSEYVKLVNADILNLVEVEDCDILREVIKRSSISDYQPLLKKGIDTATKQNVAMLTKYEPTEALYRLEAKESYPIEGSTCGYTKEGKRTTLSKNYVAHFRVNDMVIAVHSIHLKAFPKDPYSCAKREGQAKIAWASIRESITKGHEVVVFGDFNDFSSEHADVQDSVPTSSVLSILRDGGGEVEDGKSLVNVMKFLDKSKRYSNWWDKNDNHRQDPGEYSQIDHVLLSPLLASRVAHVEIFHGYDPALVSDHYPLIVSFDFETGGAGTGHQQQIGDGEAKDKGAMAVVVAVAVAVAALLAVLTMAAARVRRRATRLEGQVRAGKYEMTHM